MSWFDDGQKLIVREQRTARLSRQTADIGGLSLRTAPISFLARLCQDRATVPCVVFPAAGARPSLGESCTRYVCKATVLTHNAC